MASVDDVTNYFSEVQNLYVWDLWPTLTETEIYDCFLSWMGKIFNCHLIVFDQSLKHSVVTSFIEVWQWRLFTEGQRPWMSLKRQWLNHCLIMNHQIAFHNNLTTAWVFCAKKNSMKSFNRTVVATVLPSRWCFYSLKSANLRDDRIWRNFSLGLVPLLFIQFHYQCVSDDVEVLLNKTSLHASSIFYTVCTSCFYWSQCYRMALHGKTLAIDVQ